MSATEPTPKQVRHQCPYISCPTHPTKVTFSRTTLLTHITSTHLSQGDMPPPTFLSAFRRWVCTPCLTFVLISSPCPLCMRTQTDNPAAPPPQHTHTPLPSLNTILSTHITTQFHVPRPCRELWVETFCHLIKTYLDSPLRHNLQALLAFPKCTIPYLPQKHTNNKQYVTKAITTFRHGQWESLWTQVSPTLTLNPPTATPPKDHHLQQAIQATLAGSLTKARRLLTPPPPPIDPNLAYSKLQNLHPLPSNTSDLGRLPEGNPFPQGLTPEKVRKLILSFPSHSSPGPTGLRPAHLKDALHLPNNPALVTTFLSLLSSFILAAASNHLPPDQAPYLSSAILIGIPKKQEGVRPIAISNTLRRLVSKALAQTHLPAIHRHLFPLQTGVGVRDAPPLTNALLRHLSTNPNHSNHLLLQVDLSNAFNTISRHSILSSLYTSIPQLAPWFFFTHSTPALLFHSQGIIQSHTGVQQGDPLSPILFALGIHPIISSLPSVAPHSFHSWYLDDGNIFGPPIEVARAFQHLLEQLHPTDLKVNSEKCILSSPSSPSLPEPLKHIPFSPWEKGTTLLGLPLGSPLSINSFLNSALSKLSPLLDTLPSLNHPQAALTLLRHSLSTPRIIHLLRALPPNLLFDFPTKCANLFASSLQKCLLTTLTPRSWSQCCLPISKGGLGLIDPVRFAPICLLSSYFSLRDLLTLTNDPLHVLPALTDEAKSTLTPLKSMITTNTPVAISALLNDPNTLPNFSLPNTNYTHSHYWHKLTADSLYTALLSSAPVRDRLRLSSLPLSLSWIRLPLPIHPRLQLSPLPPAAFPLAIRRILGIPLTTLPPTLCTKCTLLDDPFGDHTLACLHSPQFHQRHNALRDNLFSLLPPHTAQREVTIQGKQRPADLLLNIPPLSHLPCAIDITIVSPVRASHSPNPYTPGATEEAEHNKNKKHSHNCLTNNYFFIPAALDTMGGIGPSAAKLFASLPIAESLSLSVSHHTIAYHTSTQLLARFGTLPSPQDTFQPYPNFQPFYTLPPPPSGAVQQDLQFITAERTPQVKLLTPKKRPLPPTTPPPNQPHDPSPTDDPNPPKHPKPPSSPLKPWKAPKSNKTNKTQWQPTTDSTTPPNTPPPPTSFSSPPPNAPPPKHRNKLPVTFPLPSFSFAESSSSSSSSSSSPPSL